MKTIFGPQFLGVAFSPYVGHWIGTPPNAKVPLWDSYSQQDIIQMLEVVSTEFDRISTYSMGYAGYYPPTTPWNKLDANCLVAGAASRLNQQRGTLAIQVAQGIYQHDNPTYQQIEIEAAFSAAKAANAVYPGTVTSFVFTNEYVVNAETANAVNTMIVNNKQKAHELNIKVGVRSHTFGEIANPNSSFYNELKRLIQNCDFIQCNLYPGEHAPNPTEGVKQVDRAFKQILTAVAKINPQCEVMIGETGWPSQGYSFNKTDNTVSNLRAYYEAMGQWAKTNRVMTYLFEAIDEPWKSAQDGKSPSSEPWKGPKGAEGHYGIWFLNAQGKYVRK